MPMIQPFTYQHCTAFRERKQLADKINEVVTVINDTDMETVNARIDQVDSKVDANKIDIDTDIADLENTMTAEFERVDANHIELSSWVSQLDADTENINNSVERLDLRVDKLENVKLANMNENQYASYIEEIIDPYGEISYGFKNDVLLVDQANTCKIHIKAHTPFELCEPIITRMNYYNDGMDTHNYKYNLNNLSPTNKTVGFTDSHLYIKPANITNSVWNNTTANKTLWTDLSVYVYIGV